MIKTKVINIINTYPKFNRQEIIKEITKADIVSFDIFDTLVKRDVARPHDVLEIAAKIVSEKEKKDIFDFKKFRVEAEQNCRLSLTNREEIYLDDIYKYIIENFGFSKELATELKNAEIQTEIDLCIPNFDMREVYQKCIEYGKKILLVSDMYLPRTVIETILDKCSYHGYTALYVSSEIGKTKSIGDLYKYVKDKESISNQVWVHIGDSLKGDMISPRKQGIKAIKIPRYQANTLYIHPNSNSFDYSQLWAFINNHSKYRTDHIERIGYEIYGPILYFFVQWIMEQTTENLPLLFFARDGYVLNKAYSAMSKRKNAIYFLGSRRSLIVPSLFENNSIERISELLQSSASRITYSDVLKKIGLDIETVKSAKLDLESFNFEEILDRNTLTNNQEFIDFYNKIRPLICYNAEQEFISFKKYCKSIGIQAGQNLQVVDIGWRCTMQNCLQSLFPDIHIKGYYIGVRENAIIKNRNDALGYFLNGEDDFEKRCMLAAMTALIEIFFSAPHGTAIRYYGNGEVELKDEYNNIHENDRRFANRLQKGALDFVKDFDGSTLSSWIHLGPEDVFNGLKQMGYHPRKQELKNYSSYLFDTGVGYSFTAVPSKLTNYIANPSSLALDFSRSNWKIGFLKNLLGIPLNYEKVFKLIYRKKHG